LIEFGEIIVGKRRVVRGEARSRRRRQAEFGPQFQTRRWTPSHDAATRDGAEPRSGKIGLPPAELAKWRAHTLELVRVLVATWDATVH
jgi:hypothetical protein